MRISLKSLGLSYRRAMLKGDRDCRMSIDIFHPVKAQHYIPRHYLSAWARRKGKRIDLIWVRIKGGEVLKLEPRT